MNSSLLPIKTKYVVGEILLIHVVRDLMTVIMCCCFKQSWMLWETSSSWMTTAPTWMRLHQLPPSHRAFLARTQPTGYVPVLGFFVSVLISSQSFFMNGHPSVCVSGWCAGGRIWPSSDSCYIKGVIGERVLLLHVS